MNIQTGTSLSIGATVANECPGGPKEAQKIKESLKKLRPSKNSKVEDSSFSETNKTKNRNRFSKLVRNLNHLFKVDDKDRRGISPKHVSVSFTGKKISAKTKQGSPTFRLVLNCCKLVSGFEPIDPKSIFFLISSSRFKTWQA